MGWMGVGGGDQGRVECVISPRPYPLRLVGLDNELKCVAYYHHQASHSDPPDCSQSHTQAWQTSP